LVSVKGHQDVLRLVLILIHTEWDTYFNQPIKNNDPTTARTDSQN
jgi:hypothetical protein